MQNAGTSHGGVKPCRNPWLACAVGLGLNTGISGLSIPPAVPCPDGVRVANARLAMHNGCNLASPRSPAADSWMRCCRGGTNAVTLQKIQPLCTQKLRQTCHGLGWQCLGPAKLAGTLSPPCTGSERCSLSVAHEDIKFNVLMSRNYHIWETLINLCLLSWVLLSSLLASPPLP